MNTNIFKEKLLEEKKILHEEIEALGGLSMGAGNFGARAEEGTDSAENIELANMFEIQESKDAVLDQLENRLLDVENALNKIESARYGICEVGNTVIEEARLIANPAARTCILHKDRIVDL